MTGCGDVIVGRITMSKRKATIPLLRESTKPNTSTDFVFYEPARSSKIRKISTTKIGKWPHYKFFWDLDGKYFPLHCIPHLGSKSFVISPEAMQAFQIPVVTTMKNVKSAEFTGREILTEGAFTLPLGVCFRNHNSYDDDDHAFEVMNTSQTVML